MPNDVTKKANQAGTSQKGQGSAYDNPKQDPKYAEKWTGPNIREYKDAVYDKISELLLKKWSEIEPHIDGSGLEALQKTYKDGKLVTGRNVNDMLVVFESDVEANADDSKVENAILGWLDFTDLSQLDLSIVTTAEVLEGGKPSPPNLILKIPNKQDFNLNEIIGSLELGDINLKDNVSQFMKLDKVQTDIDRAKLSEFVDTEFSELKPLTFTSLLEKYNNLKVKIPLRYRSDDFFREYIGSNIPAWYRVERFFEEFETIKEYIDKGALTDYNKIPPSFSNPTDEKLFGWETLTYLVTKSQDLIGSKNPIFNQKDAKTWWDKINGLQSEKQTLTVDNDSLKGEVQRLMDIILNMTGSAATPFYGCGDPAAINYNAAVTYDDGSCTYAEQLPEEIVIITAIGTGKNNSSARILKVQEKEVYNQNGSRGLRLTVFSSDSLIGAKWDGDKLHDKIYNVGASVAKQNEMAQDILGGDWKMNDLFVITSWGSVGYNDLLVEALKTIGGCYPRTESGIEDLDPANNKGTPYVLVGSKGLGDCGGYEAVGDDGPYSAPSEVIKEWRPLMGGEGGWSLDAPDPIYGCIDATATNYNALADTDDGSCQYPLPAMKGLPAMEGLPALVKGCTDITATNYKSSADLDDGSCQYPPGVPDPPPPAFIEKFDDWQDAYSPNNYWQRASIGNVIKTDGPTGVGDGGVRIYRTKPDGSWPGALHNSSNDSFTAESFDKIDVQPTHLFLQEGRTYRATVWGRCNTTNKKAQMFIGDTRGGHVGGYSWQKAHAWPTGNTWTKKEFTFVPKKNKHWGGSDKYKVKFWQYPGGSSPSWGTRIGGDDGPATIVETNKINYDWGDGAGPTGEADNFMMEAKGFVQIPQNGNYRFRIWADDGVHLWVNGQHAINGWTNSAAVDRDSSWYSLSKGGAAITLRYYEDGGHARVKFYIMGPGYGNGNTWHWASAYSDPSLPLYPGVMANIYLYAGTTNGASPGQYCDYANIELKELAREGGLLRAGGPAKSTFNPGPTNEVNSALFPTRNMKVPIIPREFEKREKFETGGNIKKRTKPVTSNNQNLLSKRERSVVMKKILGKNKKS